MRRALALFFLVALARPCSAAITATIAGTGGTNGTPITTLQTATGYNQPAGHCLLMIVNAYSASFSSPSDTAGDTFGSAIISYTGSNTNQIAVYPVYGSIANASNVMSISVSTSYATITYIDVDPGGACSAGLLDVAAMAAIQSGSPTSISDTITTVAANEAAITTLWDSTANLVSATAPAGFTAGSVLNSYSLTGTNLYSSVQTGSTLTWNYVNPSSYLGDMVVVTFKEAPPAGSPPQAGAFLVGP